MWHLLKEVPELSVGDPGTGNLLVEGVRRYGTYHSSKRCRAEYRLPPHQNGWRGVPKPSVPASQRMQTLATASRVRIGKSA
jgi:hypothetical protein